MRVLKAVAVVLVCTAALFLNANAGVTPPVAKCRVFGVSGNDVSKKIAGIDKVSNGLANVAKNTKVYLYCGGQPSKATTPDVAAAWFKSATFELFEKPATSATTLNVLDSIRVSFVPDIEGTYRIRMIGTDDKDRTGGDTLVVNVAKYVGVGNIMGSAIPPECAVCHAEIYNKWKTTPHATSTQRNLDDPAGHFQGFCLACHATGSVDVTGGGDGFMALLPTSGWTFPTALKAGNFDSLKLVAPALAKLAGVQCESCHGPGSSHNGVKADSKMVKAVTSENCRQCHDAPPHHVRVEEWENSGHANSMTEGIIPEYMNRGSTTARSSDCARCHTSNGYIDVFYKSADPLTAFTKAPYKDAGYVGCPTCHDPHSDAIPHQLRKEGNKICADCHSLRVSASSGGLHSSHQGPMLQGVSGREFLGYDYPDAAHSSIAEQCVQCHMAAPVDAKYANLLGSHTFRVVYDNATPTDVSDDVLNTTGCISCHASGVTMTDIEETQAEIKALLAELKALLPKAANGNPKGPGDTTMTKLQRDCSFNYSFVNNDGSFGVHNIKYARALLTSSIAELKLVSDVEPVAGMATSYALSQNYPNPFNPSTTITFAIPQSGIVRLAVFDASGREVSLLVNGSYQAGNYQVNWNAANLPSGVYYYRLTSGSFSSVKKMVLAK
jgi:predicted CXXCH cytochrome family protein